MLEKIMSRIGYSKVEKSVVGPLAGDSTMFKSLRELLNTSSPSQITQPYKQSAWVHACISKIIENMMRVPFVLRKDAGDLEPGIINSGPLYELFQNPNPLMNQEELIRSTMGFYCLRGEAFWIMEGRDDVTKIPKEIWTFDPLRFEPVHDRNTGWLLGWTYKGKTEVTFSVNEIIQFKMFNPYDDVRGLSPYEAAKLSSDQNYQASVYNKAFFENGAVIGGYISIPDELTDEAYDRLVKQFEDRHKGAAKAHRVAVVEGGGKFTAAKLSQREMDFTEGKKLTKDEILAVYSVNEVVLGDYTNTKCFHPDTEIFTEDGFKSVTEIKKGTKVATLNPETRKAEFKPVAKVYTYDYDGIMYKQTGKKQKIAYCVTPEHKMFGQRVVGKTTKKKTGKYELIPIKDVPGGKNFAVPRSAKWDVGESPTLYDIGKRTFERKEYHNGSKNGLKGTTFPIVPWLKFLGWFISEGNYFDSGRYEIGISQTKPEGRKQFNKDMKGFPYVITEYDRMFKLSGKDLYTYLMENVGHYCDEKRIPSDIKKLHPSLLRHLLNALLAGDGTPLPGKGAYRFSTTSLQLANDVFEIAIKLGYAPFLSGGKRGYYKDKEGERKYCKPVWSVEMRDAVLDGRISNVERIYYKGKVHCFEVPPYHVTLTRYDGKIMWIGQSYEGIKSAHKAFWEECLMPKILYFENTLWSRFFSKIGQRRGKGRVWGQFDLANVGPLQQNYAEKIATAKDMFHMGWPINDINKRLELGMKEVPWGNEWWVPGGFLPVTALQNAKPTPKKPTDEEPESSEEDDSDKNEDQKNVAIARFYCDPIEDEFHNKFKKFLFEVRKRAIAASFEQKDWDSVVLDKDVLKLQTSLSAVYMTGLNAGIASVQAELGPFDVPYDINEANRFRDARASYIANSFKALLGGIIINLSAEQVKDDKLREVFNVLSVKSSSIAKAETEASFTYGRDIALKQTKRVLGSMLADKYIEDNNMKRSQADDGESVELTTNN